MLNIGNSITNLRNCPIQILFSPVQNLATQLLYMTTDITIVFDVSGFVLVYYVDVAVNLNLENLFMRTLDTKGGSTFGLISYILR